MYFQFSKEFFVARISKSQLEKLQKKYTTDEAIGKLFNISRQAVQQLRTKYGISAIVHDTTDRNKSIVKDYKSGIPGHKLASKYKLSVTQIYRVIKTHK